MTATSYSEDLKEQICACRLQARLLWEHESRVSLRPDSVWWVQAQALWAYNGMAREPSHQGGWVMPHHVRACTCICHDSAGCLREAALYNSG